MKNKVLTKNVEEKLFGLLIDSVKDYAIFMLDPDGFVTSWNKGARQIKGYSAKEIIGKHMSVFYTKADNHKKEPQHNLAEALKKGSYENEGWRVRKDGSVFWANVVFTPLYDNDNVLLGFAKVTRDITERKRAQDRGVEINLELEKRVKEKTENIIAAETRYRKLIENSHDGIILFDRDLHMIYRSASSERINGWSLEERERMEMTSMIHPEDKAMVGGLFLEILSKPGQPVIATYRARHKLGHYLWLECLFNNMLEDPDIQAIVCNFRDVTQAKEAHLALQKTNKELFTYKFALDEWAIVAITDQKGIIKHVNDNFCRISKYTARELIGQDHRLINSGYHDKTFIRHLWQTITAGNIWKGELKNRAKDGSYYWVDTTIVPFLNEKGKPYQYVAIRADITERKKAEEKLIESEIFIKTIADNLPAIIIYWSSDLRCLFANKTTRDFFGLREGDTIGMSREALTSQVEQDARDSENRVAEVLRGVPQIFENRIKGKDGKSLFFKVHYLPDWQGDTVRGYYALAFDITELKLAEADIRKKADLIQDLLENITDGFISLDANLRYTYVNRQIGKMLGRDPGELIGKNIWETFPDAVGSATYQAVMKAFTEKKYASNEDFYEPLGLWQENRVYPAGSGISMFIRDITKVKQEEQHLKLLESVVTNTTDAVLITEADPLNEPGPRIMYVNQAFTKMTGYGSDEVIGKTPRLLWGPKTDKTELGRLSAALRNKEPCQITVVNYKKNGEEFWNNFAVSPVTDSQGKCTHFIAVERDVTESKRSEIHLEQLNRSLEKHARELAISNAELEQFAYIASHDLQEPLRMVTSFLSQLEKKYGDVVDSKGKQYIFFAVDGAKRMRQIILDLLEYSRVGRPDEDLDKVDFSVLLGEVTALYKRQMEELGATILFEGLPVLPAYKIPLRQVFLNLVGNSLKYHKAGEPPVIEIACREINAFYQFSVKDNGIGIEAEYFEKIFIIFQRLHNKEQYSGTGMGLAITKKIIENLGGKIWVESELGKGSTFYFTIVKQ